MWGAEVLRTQQERTIANWHPANRRDEGGEEIKTAGFWLEWPVGRMAGCGGAGHTEPSMHVGSPRVWEVRFS